MTSPTIEIDLGSVLQRIEQSLTDSRQETNQKLDNLSKEVTDLRQETNQKLDNLNKEVTDLKVGQARMEGDIQALKEDVKDIKGSQKAQIWTLIGILATAVLGLLAAGGKILFFSGNP